MDNIRRPDNMERITTPALAKAFIEEQLAAIKAQVGDGKVLLALSGGVDSSVCAALISKAIGKQLICVHVNHGLLRKGEPEQVIEVFRNQFDVNLIYVDAVDRFLDKLAGVSDPETKRHIIGEEFIDVFAEEARKLEGVSYLGQGTIWPDILESEAGIKAHHNAGGLPDDIASRFELVEPVRILFKDEVRCVGRELGLPESMVERQPFPGPGLGVRCPGAITRDRLEAVRESDAILREEFAKNGLEGKVWQYFTVVPDFKSTGIKDGKRTFDWMCIIRAINTTDVVEVSVEHLPNELIDHLVKRITTEVPGINRVLVDYTPKPPATVEYE
jgi:GMP synthase (glutamine-hydrolysing)